jgi:prevent-host-death family protein
MEIGIHEVKARLSELIDRAEVGETVVITRAGRPVAHLVAEPEVRRARARETFERMWSERRHRQILAVAEMLEMRDDGRRF